MKVRIVIAALAVAAGVGCQVQPRKPMDIAGHMAEYRARTAASVAEFAARLNEGPAARVVFDPSDGLSVEEAEVVALMYSAELREARAGVGVAAAGAKNAGLWEDPMVEVSVERMLTSMGQPWKVMGGVGFTLPITGLPGYEKKMAEGELAVEEASAAAMEWETRGKVRRAWVEWSAASARVGVMEEALAEVESVLARVERIEAAGEIQRVEAQMFRIERAMVMAELAKERGEVAVKELGVKREMGLAPGAEVRLLARLVFGADEGAPVSEAHPKLVLAEVEYEGAERALELEVRKQYPSLGVSPGVGRDQGDSLLAMGLSLPVPLLNGNRQGIARAVAARELERVRCERMHEELESEAAVARAELRARRGEREAFESGVVPLVDAQAADIARITGAGKVDTVMILNSVTRRSEAKARVIEARMNESLATIDVLMSTYQERAGVKP